MRTILAALAAAGVAALIASAALATLVTTDRDLALVIAYAIILCL
jgi:hypothetical protein